jgi:cell wall-associated NlpC family hydrolase
MKKVMLLICFLVSSICGKPFLTEEEIRENIINTAAKLLGTPYRSGGSSENGFDCSGFVRFVMENNNIRISRSSKDQIDDGFAIPLEAVQPGDLLIFKGANKNASRPGHSGIVHHTDDNGIVHFIHSASSKGITIDNLKMDYYKNRFIEARNVITGALNK